MFAEGLVSATQLVSRRQAGEVANLPWQPLPVFKVPPLPTAGLSCTSCVPQSGTPGETKQVKGKYRGGRGGIATVRQTPSQPEGEEQRRHTKLA